MPVGIDESTGSPIPGLSVAIGTDQAEPAWALLVIADGFEQYPLQIVILEGTHTAGKPPGRQTRAIDGTDLSIPVNPGDNSVLSSVVSTLQTGILGSLTPTDLQQPTDLSTSFLSALQALYTSDIFLPPPLTGVSPSIVETSPEKDISEAKEHILNNAQDALIAGLPYVLLNAATGATPTTLTELAPAAIQLSYVTVWEQLGATGITFQKFRFGGIIVELPLPVFTDPPADFFPPDPTLNIMATDPVAQPISGGSIKLLCDGILGLGIIGVLDTAGQANLPVPSCHYTGEMTAAGYLATSVDVTVPEEGTSLNLMPQPQPIADVMPTSSPDLTGFLSPGTEVQFVVVATDADGNVVPCNAVYIANNPVGSTVATIQTISPAIPDPEILSSTGLLTVGSDDGAAKVTARCGGVTSNSILVSSTGEGDTPAPPSSGDTATVTCENSIRIETGPADSCECTDLTPVVDPVTGGLLFEPTLTCAVDTPDELITIITK